ncbi:efflux RND transporter periplasmic adaptor subunit [Pedobacter cryoconitis]|uniref:Cobalt-zinc-cadmium efflux system membrane fusion protein n=1 Tax=Pedobacter cryoconitis TaxID=188932 RepID=A0A327SJN6_9SPHI|nr:efflux RND transporter periplasmic adaptor subunit [Pedobacter cryoconitis]RAJ28114.1 cobalt-zinc-cadmium efflux system membrane fusion protein [Pedobacter cryoconitis]
MKTLNYITAFMLSLLTLTACNQAAKEEKKEVKPAAKVNDEVRLSKDQYRVTALQTGELEMRSLSNVIKANGAIDVPPENMVSISAPLGGYIKSYGLLPGQLIRKGQVIATIENPVFIDIQQEYLESQSRLEFLSLEYKRQEQLRKEDVNSAKTFQQVSSDYKMIQARMSGLEQKLSLIGINAKNLNSGKISKTSNLYSPINGFVTVSNATTGKYVNPTDVIFELANKSEMHLALNVYEKDADKIKVGQTIKFALANETAYNRNAKVFLIGKSTGTEGTVPVHCHLPDAGNPALFPGMYAKALIATTYQSVPSLPADAIVQSDGVDYIFIQTAAGTKGFTFKMIPVKKGIEQEGYVEVILPDNFNRQSAIVLKGAYTLLSAMKNVEE